MMDDLPVEIIAYEIHLSFGGGVHDITFYTNDATLKDKLIESRGVDGILEFDAFAKAVTLNGGNGVVAAELYEGVNYNVPTKYLSVVSWKALGKGDIDE